MQGGSPVGDTDLTWPPQYPDYTVMVKPMVGEEKACSQQDYPYWPKGGNNSSVHRWMNG